jgi:hypothetical protein
LAQILHVHEIAQLLTVLVVGAVAAEELHAARGADLVEGVEHHAGHAALVVFVRAIHVEELQTSPEERLLFLLQRPLVELVLALAVRIQGFQTRRQGIFQITVPQCTIAIRGC